MKGKKNASQEGQSAGGLAGFLRGHARSLILLTLFVAACAFGWTFLWAHVRDHVMASGDYRLDPDTIEITPLPEWIHADLKREVIRDASLDATLSTLDPELNVTIARAFGLHPWVAKVERVTKRYPAGVQVELVYRKPAAMVEVAGPALLPVDADGYLLPTEDFSPADAGKYPRIGEIKTSPLGPVGTRWGDTRVTGAAQVAAALSAQWNQLKLRQVVPAGRGAGPRGVETDAYEVFTVEGTRIEWGRPPDAEIAGEAKAATKVARLVEYAAQHGGGLDESSRPQRLDVRPSGGLLVAVRPAIQPLPRDEKPATNR